jgi:prefoldin alpha subunit
MAGQQQQKHQRSDQQFLTSAFSVYATEVRKAINNQQEQLSQLEAAHEQLQQTLDSLEQLPTKLRHPVMVPMGKHAFFPGHITRTNEIMVHLGGHYYVEVTAAHARGILQRKQAAVADGISKAQQQLKALRARLEVSSDSIGSATADEPEAHEIRSSLAESDALLASAPPRAGKAAALSRHGQQQQQQQRQQEQQQAQRVRSSSGYSYTRPQGASTEQRSPQQDAKDAELQARLEQLLLLEQQQELQDLLQNTPATEQQQQQQQLGPGLGTIQEGEEDSDSEAPAAVAVVGEPSGGVGSAGQLSAVHHLQQLEAQSDSDDDVAAYRPQPEQQQQQQQPQQQQRSPGQGQQSVAQQQLQQQRPPLKSALKKGFLGAAASSSSSSSSSRGRAADRSASTQAPAKPKPAAFTGTVVERSAPQAAAAVAHPPAVGGIVERPVQAVGSSTVPAASGGSSSSNKPMSKFKLRRLGLDPQDD